MDTFHTSTAGCCGDEPCNSGRRNRYFPRKQITADTYEIEQRYQQQRRHLINRAIHGWGVVYGYGIEAQVDKGCGGNARFLEIKSGLALDACGRELVWLGTECAQPHRVDLADVLALDEEGKLLNEPGKRCRSKDGPSAWDRGHEGACWRLRVHYAERLVSPVSVKDPCQCDSHEWDQVCETVRFSLEPIDCEKCCEATGCELHCDCRRSHCCARDPKKPAARGGCSCLCDHATRRDPNPSCCALTHIGLTLRVDLHNGVPLACVKLARDECGDWTFAGVVESCAPRRLVKNNDLLFDLIRGCDLTRISEVSWQDWHRGRASFAEFRKRFGPDDGQGASLTSFSVKFSGPVQVATIRPDCFAMTVIARDDEDGWGRTLRVPIVKVRIDDPDPMEKDLAGGATLMVDSDWAKGALDDVSVFAKYVTRVEILVRGDYLLDCNGIPVDANARGASAAPTGNGVPGDTYVSTFIVEEMQPGDYQTKPNIREV
jgi:hypothetical protein